MQTLDETIPGAQWAFDADVTDAFDDMLRRSIPQYEVMRDTVFRLAASYVVPGGYIVDLGCSRGEALAPFIDQFGANNRYMGLELSAPMLTAARERYAGWIENKLCDIQEWDLRRGLPMIPGGASVMLSVLTLQFTPIEYRQALVRAAYKALRYGGVFILVEKVLGATADLDALMVQHYYDLKRLHHYTEEQIQRKRLSLEGVLVPITARWNEELLQAAGFRQIDCFWRWMNFAGWIAVRE